MTELVMLAWYLAIAALTTACVTNTLLNSLFFASARQWAEQRLKDKGPRRAMVLAGLKCPYCVSHYIAAAVLLLLVTWREAALLFFPVVWVANHPRMYR